MSSRLITDGDRAHILDQLKNAPDSVLITAFNQWHKERENALLCRETINVELGRSSFDDGAVDSGKSSAKFPDTSSSTSVDDSSERTRRLDVSPGNSSISKIGSATRIDLLAMVKAGQQPHKKYEEHLKLLWERGEVKFDGKEWWV